jgi:hypothetical protein
MQPRPPAPPVGRHSEAHHTRSHLSFGSDDDHPHAGGALIVVGGHHGAEIVSSAQELENRFSINTLRHAAQCVGLDYTTDIQGSQIGPCYGSLAEIDPSVMFQLLSPHHDDDALLRQLVEIVAKDTVVDDIDEELSATHASRRQSFSGTMLSDVEQHAFVSRLHKIYRNPNDRVPLEVVKSAEIALRRYNAKQKETESSLRRVFHACMQLEEQQKKYARHNLGGAAPANVVATGRPHSAPSGRAGSIMSIDGASVTTSGRRNPSDAVGKLLMHLKRQAVAERNYIRRELVIRAQEHADAFSVEGSSPRHHDRQSKGSTEAGMTDDVSLVSARRHRRELSAQNAFQEAQIAQKRRCEEEAAAKQRKKEASDLAEYKLAMTLGNAERRRYEFLRNRELRIRANSERAAELSTANKEFALTAMQNEERKRREELLVTKEEHLARITEENKKMQQRTSLMHRRQQDAIDRARALQEARAHRAAEQERKYKEHMEMKEHADLQKAAEASLRRQAIEEKRRAALNKAKKLEAQKVLETEALRNIMDTDQERRKRQHAYLKSIRDEENRIKEEQRRRLVHQYAQAREYRENAFRSQWECELQRRQEEEKERKRFASSLHQLQLREEAKLRGIIGSRQFNGKDIEKLNLFIAELDALTASPSIMEQQEQQ